VVVEVVTLTITNQLEEMVVVELDLLPLIQLKSMEERTKVVEVVALMQMGLEMTLEVLVDLAL
jgi:hypothetical protein